MKRVDPFAVGMMAVATLATIMAGVYVGCSAGQTGRTLSITTGACAELAKNYDRPDIERVCMTSHNVADVLEVLLDGSGVDPTWRVHPAASGSAR